MNKSQTKKLIFAVLYAVLSALFIAAMFTNFLTATNSEAILPSLDGVQFNFVNLITIFDNGTKGNAVATVVMLILLACFGLANIVLSVLQSVKGANKLASAKFWLFLTSTAFVLGLYGVLASFQFHILSLTIGGTAITAFFVINLLTPLLFLAVGIFDNFQEIKSTLFAGGNFKKCFPTTFAYIAVAVLAVVFFILPVYQYDVSFDGITSTSTYTLSFFGFNEFSAMLNFRSTLLLAGCAVFAFIMFLTNCKINVENDINALKKIKTLRFVLCLAFVALFVFCFPSVLNYVNTCSQEIADVATLDAVSNAGRGATFYAAIALPVLTFVLCLCDGVQEFVRINSATKSASSTKEIINSIITAIYTAVFILLFLSLSIPYASYYLKTLPEATFFIYIMNYRGVSGFEYINGVPTTNLLFIYVMIAIVLVAISVAVLYFGRTKAIGGKNINTLRKITVGAKTVIATAFTIIFAYMNGYLPFYREQIAKATGITDSVLNMTAVSIILDIAMIAYLALVWADLFICLYYCYKETKTSKK